MAINVDIYNREIVPQEPYYNTFSVLISEDIVGYATENYVNSLVVPLQTNINTLFINVNALETNLNVVRTTYLPLTGGTITGSLSVANVGSAPGRITLYSNTGLPLTLENSTVFQTGAGPELGLVLPRLLLTQGRFDIDPDLVLNRAEFRLSNTNAEFNIFNKSSLRFYMRINPNGGITFADNLSQNFGNNSLGVGTSLNITSNVLNSVGIGSGVVVEGSSSAALGVNVKATNAVTQAYGILCEAVTPYSWIWRGTATGIVPLSTTRTGQFMVSAEGGISLHNRVGIGTDSVANALTVVGNISSSDTVFTRNLSTVNIFIQNENILQTSPYIPEPIITYSSQFLREGRVFPRLYVSHIVNNRSLMSADAWKKPGTQVQMYVYRKPKQHKKRGLDNNLYDKQNRGGFKIPQNIQYTGNLQFGTAVTSAFLYTNSNQEFTDFNPLLFYRWRPPIFGATWGLPTVNAFLSQSVSANTFLNPGGNSQYFSGLPTVLKCPRMGSSHCYTTYFQFRFTVPSSQPDKPRFIGPPSKIVKCSPIFKKEASGIITVLGFRLKV